MSSRRAALSFYSLTHVRAGIELPDMGRLLQRVEMAARAAVEDGGLGRSAATGIAMRDCWRGYGQTEGVRVANGQVAVSAVDEDSGSFAGGIRGSRLSKLAQASDIMRLFG